MIDTGLLKHPEQLAARLTELEKNIKKNSLEIEKLKKKVGV